MNDATKVSIEILEEGVDDWVPTDRLIGRAKELHPSSGEQFKNLFKEVLNLLLTQDLVCVGDIGDEGFTPWDGSTSEIMERVISECESLNWAPFGGGCWLSNTPAGDLRVAWIRTVLS